MQETVINGELGISYPDSFSVMSPDELKQAYNMDYSSMWGMRDKENHVVFSVIWKASFDAMQKLMSSASLAKRAEKALSKAFRKQGYRCDGFFERAVAGQQGQGFAYSYEVGGQRQDCETIVIRQGKNCYTLYYYSRADLAQANRAMYEDMLASLKFV